MLPAVPEKVDVGLVGVVIVPPVPETIIQLPVAAGVPGGPPPEGALPASVTVVDPQVAIPVMSAPARAGVTKHAGLIGTANIAQFVEALRVEDMVTDAAPGLVLPAM